MKRSKFSLSHYKLLTCDMGELVPCACVEVLPGDSFMHSSSALVRVSPLLTPVMHPVEVKIHHWFVPTRIVWPGFEAFITGGPDGMDATVPPVIEFGEGARSSPAIGSLADYLGIPPGLTDGQQVSAVPFRAYAKIWNEFYRDQDLQTPLVINEGNGLDTTTSIDLQNVGWEKDYFTSSRPWTQKGPDVTLPIGDIAPVVAEGPGAQPLFSTLNDLPGNTPLQVNNGSPIVNIDSNAGETSELFWGTTGLQADLSDATAVSINRVREAFALQRYEEARARYGSRYTEYLRYLGVRSSDARLQRPEYLGGGKQTIQFSEVLQTSPSTTPDQALGTMGGHGITAVRSNRYVRFFEEHGYVITLMSVKPKTMYAQGIHRTWSRSIKEDYWQRELQHIGQQPILNRELYFDATEPTDTFGFQDRYDEYRRMESGISGDFRDTLDMWHYARIFATEPALNADFVRSVPTKRVNAVQTEDVLWCMVKHQLRARRMVSASAGGHIF